MRLHCSITSVIVAYSFCLISYKPGEILAFGLLFLVSMKNLFYVGRKLKKSIEWHFAFVAFLRMQNRSNLVLPLLHISHKVYVHVY